MGGEFFWPALRGLSALLSLGALLALAAAWLPRLLAHWERGTELRPLPPEAASPSPQPRPAAVEAPPPPPRFEPAFPAPRIQPEGLDHSVVAAIATALALHFPGEARIVAVAPQAESASPWTLAGRWQAMAARVNLPKR